MPCATVTSGLPSQNPQGTTARLFRRIGATLRGAFGSIALTGNRRPAVPRAARRGAGPRDSAAPSTPRPPRAPRPPLAAAPPQPRPGWLARLFGRKPRQHATAAPGRRATGRNGPFAAGSHPRLSPEERAFLNTPLEQCDPALLRIVVAVVARHIANSMPPGLGMSDDAVVFDQLWSRFSARLGLPQPESPPDPPVSEPSPAPAPAATDSAAESAAPRSGPAVHHIFIRSKRRQRPQHPRPMPARQCTSHSRYAASRTPAPPPRRLFYASCAGPP